MYLGFLVDSAETSQYNRFVGPRNNALSTFPIVTEAFLTSELSRLNSTRHWLSKAFVERVRRRWLGEAGIFLQYAIPMSKLRQAPDWSPSTTRSKSSQNFQVENQSFNPAAAQASMDGAPGQVGEHLFETATFTLLPCVLGKCVP